MNVLSLFDGQYVVADNGKIFSNKRKIKKELIGKVTKYGYRMIVFTINKKKVYVNAHRIVAKSFIPNPLNKPEVNHIDGDKLNNSVINLEWVTASENQKHAQLNGLCKSNKININIANEIRTLYNTGKYTTRVLASMFGLGKTQIGYIIKNKRWKI